jgi:hypothetical protein
MALAALFVSPRLARLAVRNRSAIANREFWKSPIWGPAFERRRKKFSMASHHPEHAAGAPVDFRKGGRICVRRQDIAP